MIPCKAARSLCEEFLPNRGPKFRVISADDGYIPTIETAVSMDQLSALSMRMYRLGWILNDVLGVISKIEVKTNTQSDPIVYVEYLNPDSLGPQEAVPEHAYLN